ncbi:PAAR domain-containing protein [Curvibacter sp. CHRR-16]|uniref:PAAR domain-containing protein n=1 Tax=Curvibacter sp. CHRR-16 TaxID=2835872 RepID=UPI001BD99626|nr:PAAR domain-containing protein [Curvibacter sp. CHRR-16]MBT0571814.1 PAAR domain-containing protein [Curvibacter sp. CHRR-16]
MGRKIIVVGDPTSHGGTVISGSPTRSIQGKAIARMGDSVDCPQKYPDKSPHGVNAIVEGDPTCLIDGVPVALDGHKTACGCSLIGTVPVTHG